MNEVVALLYPLSREGSRNFATFKGKDPDGQVKECRELEEKHGLTLVFHNLADLAEHVNTEELNFSDYDLNFINKSELKESVEEVF